MPDREKVIKGLEEVDAYFHRMTEVCYRGDEATFCDLKEKVTDAIALLKEQDAKTGHWIEKEDYNLDTYYDCSVCGESWSMIDGTPWENGMNYCPHCGAKMEGR